MSGCVEMLIVMYRKGCGMSTGSRWRPKACAASSLLLWSTPMETLSVEMDNYKGTLILKNTFSHFGEF